MRAVQLPIRTIRRLHRPRACTETGDGIHLERERCTALAFVVAGAGLAYVALAGGASDLAATSETSLAAVLLLTGTDQLARDGRTWLVGPLSPGRAAGLAEAVTLAYVAVALADGAAGGGLAPLLAALVAFIAIEIAVLPGR